MTGDDGVRQWDAPDVSDEDWAAEIARREEMEGLSGPLRRLALSEPLTPPRVRDFAIEQECWERAHAAMRPFEWWLEAARKTSPGRTMAEACQLVGAALASGRVPPEFRDGYLPAVGADWRRLKIDPAQRLLICPDDSRHRFEDVYVPFERAATSIDALVKAASRGFMPLPDSVQEAEAQRERGASAGQDTPVGDKAIEPPRPASNSEIGRAIRTAHGVIEQDGMKRPNVKEWGKFVRIVLRRQGLTVSDNHVSKVLGEQEFRGMRGEVGKTLRSTGRKPLTLEGFKQAFELSTSTES